MRVKEESEKVCLKFNIQKTKIMVSSPITSWQLDGEKVEAVTDFVFLGNNNDIYQLFMFLLTICILSLGICLFRSSAFFFIELLIFLILICMSCLYILEIKPLSFSSFANIYSQSIGSLFILFMVSFAMQYFKFD